MAGSPIAGSHARRRRFYEGLSELLAEHARAVFRLRTPREDGTTEEQHLLALRRNGHLVPELDIPDPPALAQPVLVVFWELHQQRGRGMSGAPLCIDNAALVAWEQLHRTRLTPWELHAIRLLDTVFFDSRH